MLSQITGELNIGHLNAACHSVMAEELKLLIRHKEIFALGVEKIAISSSVISNPEIITTIAGRVGRQSVVVVLDVKRRNVGGYEICTVNGTQKTSKDPAEMARIAENFGAGEIVINSIDRDGTMQGYDFDLVEKVKATISLPLTVLGGAGSLEDIGRLIEKYNIIGAAAGSIFVFKGTYRAVLISYPDPMLKDKLIREAIKV